MQHPNSTPTNPTLFERLTREPPPPTIRYPRDPSQPFIDRRAIIEDAKALVKDADVIATLAKDIDGTPSTVTLSQLRMQAMQSNPALQPAARVQSQSETVATRLDNVRTLLTELSDLQDEVFGSPEKVSLRALLETLRHVEGELEAAVGRLAGELGLEPLNPQDL